MNANKDLWKRVCVTDPRHVKPITGKQYSGNSPKPYWIVERLTDEFGPCGIGWGFTILSDRFERFGEGAAQEALHVASVRLWYVLDGKRGELEQVGQTRAAYMSSKGKYIVDEDAPKKSVTDALVKCASYLGFAGDIFSGLWDDSKYVAQAGREWAEREAAEQISDWACEMIRQIKTEADVAKLSEIAKAGTSKANDAKDKIAYDAIRNAAMKRHEELTKEQQ